MMEIPNNILKNKLKKVLFIWGSGKTVTANALDKKYGFFVYHTDNRAPHFKRATPEFQPAMCRDVPDFWVLGKEDALGWEKDIVREMTPMILCDLIELSGKYDRIICEGDIDIDSVIHIVSHAVMIVNQGESYDFFHGPDQQHMLDSIQNRTDISEEEKQALIENAYQILRGDLPDNGQGYGLPRETTQYYITPIFRNTQTPPEKVADMVMEYWKNSQ